MQKASCQFVLRVYGNYLGSLPFQPMTTMQQGIVMEYMGRGSVQSLMSKLSDPQPWPLVFRLAHQVAQGMNFLHSMDLMHQDLKPSNVLLNDDLNAKVVAKNLNSSVCLFCPSMRPTQWFDVMLYVIFHGRSQTLVCPGFPPVF